MSAQNRMQSAAVNSTTSSSAHFYWSISRLYLRADAVHCLSAPVCPWKTLQIQENFKDCRLLKIQALEKQKKDEIEADCIEHKDYVVLQFKRTAVRQQKAKTG